MPLICTVYVFEDVDVDVDVHVYMLIYKHVSVFVYVYLRICIRGGTLQPFRLLQQQRSGNPAGSEDYTPHGSHELLLTCLANLKDMDRS